MNRGGGFSARSQPSGGRQFDENPQFQQKKHEIQPHMGISQEATSDNQYVNKHRKNKKPQKKDVSQVDSGGGSYNNLKQSVQNPKQKRNYSDKGDRPKADYSSMVQTEETNILITQVDGPLHFWAQRVEPTSHVEEMLGMSEKLESVCTRQVAEPILFQIYGAMFSQDQMWYRCQPIKDLGNDKFQVCFIDYGNTEIKDVSELYELPQSFSSLKPYARRYCLYGLKSAFTDKETTGFAQGTERLKSLIMNRSVRASLYSQPYPKAPYIAAILMDLENSIDINQEMLSAGFAKRWFFSSPNKSVQQGKRPGIAANFDATQVGERPAITSQNRESSNEGLGLAAQNPGGYNRNSLMDSEGSTKMKAIQQSPQQHKIFSTQHQYTKISSSHEQSAFMSSGDGPLVDVAQLRHKQSQLEKENMLLKKQVVGDGISALEADRDRKTLELSEAKGQVKMLQISCNKLEEEVSRLRKQQHEKDINNRMLAIQAGVTKVKKLRLQFPTDTGVKDNIQEAIDALLNGQRIFTDLDVTKPVRQACTAYEFSQERVKACTDKNVLNDSIEVRNTMRKDLHSVISTFAESVADLPLAERSTHLRNCIKGLEDTHHVFLNAKGTKTMDLNEVVDMYNTWKIRLRFHDVRAATNADQNSLTNALGLLRKQLTLDLNIHPRPSPGVGDLNLLLFKFEEDLNTEMAATDIEKTEDANFISLLLNTLRKELAEELDNIDKLHELVISYDSLKIEINNWLDTSPDVSELMSLRSSMKQLKSQLRHKLADKQDLEEADESDGEEMSMVIEALEDIRKQLHRTFNQEESILAGLSSLADKHFPELFLTYSELRLDNELKYKGMVKLGRSLDQYCTTVLTGVEKSGMFQSVYMDNPIVLKEYFIEESLGIKKSDFLDRALQYYSVASSHLVPVHGLFFVKDRNAYVQIPYYGKCLARMDCSVIQKWSEKDKHAIIKGVVEGLKALHDSDIVHGAVHPNNVFIKDDNHSLLAEYDFSRTLKQRSEKVYTTTSGLAFTSKDSVHCNKSQATDMYMLGLLILYLYSPLVKSPDTATQLSLTGVHPFVQGVVQNLVQDDPAERYTAAELLEEPYFEGTPTQENDNKYDTVSDNESDHIEINEESQLDEDQNSSHVIEEHVPDGLTVAAHTVEDEVHDVVEEHNTCEPLHTDQPDNITDDLIGNGHNDDDDDNGDAQQEAAKIDMPAENGDICNEFDYYEVEVEAISQTEEGELDSETLENIVQVVKEQDTPGDTEQSGSLKLSRLSIDDIKKLVTDFKKSKVTDQ